MIEDNITERRKHINKWEEKLDRLQTDLKEIKYWTDEIISDIDKASLILEKMGRTFENAKKVRNGMITRLGKNIIQTTNLETDLSRIREEMPFN